MLLLYFSDFVLTFDVNVWASPQTTLENKYALVALCREGKDFLKRSFVRKFKSKTMVLQFRTQLTRNELSSAIWKPLLKGNRSFSSRCENKTTFWKSCSFEKSLGKRFFHFFESIKINIKILSVTNYHTWKQLEIHRAMPNTIFLKFLENSHRTFVNNNHNWKQASLFCSS